MELAKDEETVFSSAKIQINKFLTEVTEVGSKPCLDWIVTSVKKRKFLTEVTEVCASCRKYCNWHILSLNKSHGIVKKFRLAYEVVHRTVLFVLYKFGNRTCDNGDLSKLSCFWFS